MFRKTALLAFAVLLCAGASAASADSSRNDYANQKFNDALTGGMKAFYDADYKGAGEAFTRALSIVPDNTLALAFLGASADQEGSLQNLVNVAEEAVAGAPKNYANHVRLGFAYLFDSQARPNRVQDALAEFNAAIAIDPKRPAAHVGLGILRFNERSANRAKIEFLAALDADPTDVLAREYLGQIYQTDVQEPERALTYLVGIPNLVPSYADAWFHVGSVLFDLKQYPQALVNLKKGIQLDTKHVGEAGQYGYTLAARALIEEKQFDAAKDMLQASIDAQVDVIYAKALLAKINRGDYDPNKEKDAKS
jgi:tetratricopeptide (TPR) repeat protein